MGDIISEPWAPSNRNAWAPSSDSASSEFNELCRVACRLRARFLNRGWTLYGTGPNGGDVPSNVELGMAGVAWV